MNFILPIPGGKIAVPYFITVISVLMISVSIFNMADTAMSGGVHIYDNTQGNLLEEEGIIDEYLLHDVRLTRVYGMDYTGSEYFCVGYFMDSSDNEICSTIVLHADDFNISDSVNNDWSIDNLSISGRFVHDKNESPDEYTEEQNLKEYDLNVLANYDGNPWPDEFYTANNRTNTLVYVGEIEDYKPRALYKDILESAVVFILGIFFLFSARIIFKSMYIVPPVDKSPIPKKDDFGDNDFWDSCYFIKEKLKRWSKQIIFWIIIVIIACTLFLIISQYRYYESINHLKEWAI